MTMTPDILARALARIAGLATAASVDPADMVDMLVRIEDIARQAIADYFNVIDWTLPIETGDGRPATVTYVVTDTQGREVYAVTADWHGASSDCEMFFGAHGRWGDYEVRNHGSTGRDK